MRKQAHYINNNNNHNNNNNKYNYLYSATYDKNEKCDCDDDDDDENNVKKNARTNSGALKLVKTWNMDYDLMKQCERKSNDKNTNKTTKIQFLESRIKNNLKKVCFWFHAIDQ